MSEPKRTFVFGSMELFIALMFALMLYAIGGMQFRVLQSRVAALEAWQGSGR